MAKASEKQTTTKKKTSSKKTASKKKTKKGIKITRKSVNLFGKFIVILLSDHIHKHR